MVPARPREVLDRTVELHYRRDHLQLNPRMLGFTQEQIQPLDQASHAQNHEADRQYQCSEMLRHFEKMMDK
jgi:hypothetical protein